MNTEQARSPFPTYMRLLVQVHDNKLKIYRKFEFEKRPIGFVKSIRKNLI